MNGQEIHRYFTYSIYLYLLAYNLMCLYNFISFYQNVSVCTQIKEFKVREFEDRKRIETVHTHAHGAINGTRHTTCMCVCAYMRKSDRVMRTRWEHSNNKEKKIENRIK